jgi:hypothetical protein
LEKVKKSIYLCSPKEKTGKEFQREMISDEIALIFRNTMLVYPVKKDKSER